ncbi:MAG TPA: redox-regulated ATPase YchF [Thermoplasmata archaeon]|nr:redox-regulated ATPase YchF [Thermoplasmata archaeon]
MGMQIGIVGKPNVGKSTFFTAATESEAEIASYPFTTIDANRGIMFVRATCPCKEFGISCTPHNSRCVDGTRLIPIEAIDVAGLVPDAHKGKGLGNKFLDDLRQADAFIHVVDVSGGTDEEGNICGIGFHDPCEDVEFLEKEICHWFKGIIKKDWMRIARQCEVEGKKIEKMLAEKLTGLKINEDHVHRALTQLSLQVEKPSSWSDEDLLNLAFALRRIAKPMVIALNKCDLITEDKVKMVSKMLEDDGYLAVPTSAEAELALKRAMKKGLINYVQGASHFEVNESGRFEEKQRTALDYIRTHVLQPYDSTGVQVCVEKTVFELLNLIVVYPVEDENHLTDKQGNVLPDAYLVPKGSTARDLAYKVHTDLGEGFIRAVDARTHRVIGSDYELKDGDIIRVVAKT